MRDLATHSNSLMSTALLALVLIFASGCATVAPPASDLESASADDQRSRAERVFLYQSRVADSLLDHYPMLDVFAEADPQLIVAEAHMTRSCSPLAQAVLTHFEGEQPSLGLRLRVLTTIGECERAARYMDNLLNNGLASNDTI